MRCIGLGDYLMKLRRGHDYYNCQDSAVIEIKH